MANAVHRFHLVLLALLLAGCTQELDDAGSDLLDSKLERKASPYAGENKRARLQKLIEDEARSNSAGFEGITELGDDQLTGKPISKGAAFAGGELQDIKLNLVEVPVAEAAKSVLGDILELNYSVDTQVGGSVTLQTSRPVTRRKLLAMFESVLRDAGAAIVDNGDSYRVVPLAAAARSLATIDAGGAKAKPGVRPHVVALRYIGAEDMRQLLEPIVPEGMILKADSRRNVLLLAGNAGEIATIRETISVFDVDWMKGMSVALVPVRSSRPDAIVADLEQIYETKTGPLKNILRFVPNKRLKSVLVISSRANYLKDAKKWIAKLDVLAETSEETLHVYRVQNRTATDLASVLQSVLSSQARTGKRRKQQTGGEVAPKLGTGETSVVAVPDEPTSGPETPLSGPGSDASYQNEIPDLGTLGGDQGSGAGGDGEPQRQGARVVADDANNSLLIFAARDEYERIVNVLEEIDSVPNQVLLEAVIAEVNLDDDMRFGVRWLFGESNNNGTFSDLANGAVAQSFPGFSYFLKANDISFSLNALSSVTDVRVLSSPSLVVLDNKKATLQVGDQVPIVTQSARGTSSGDAPVINNVELKDTGVILNVTPRVNDSGQVTLEIEQEVSSVVKTTTSGIDSPTIRQRKVRTSVVISDGEALALGGLIQESEQTGKTKVPILGDVPLLGNAFRQKTNKISRTELIIFIRPRVIRNLNEARRITREFRKELGVRAPRVRREEPTPGKELIRILN